MSRPVAGGEKRWSKHDVDAGAGGHHRPGIGILHAPHGIRERSGGVDDGACRHLETFAREPVDDLGSAHSAPLLHEGFHGDVVGDDGALARRREPDGEVHARVVELAVVVQHAPAQPLLFEHGEALERLLGIDEAARLQVGAARQPVVELQAGEVVGDLQPVVQRRDDRQGVAEVRRDTQQHRPLVQSVAHEVELRAVEVLDRLLQVAHAAVDELGAAAAGTAGEVSALDQRDTQAARGGVERYPRAGGASADHEQVEGAIIGPQSGQLFLAIGPCRPHASTHLPARSKARLQSCINASRRASAMAGSKRRSTFQWLASSSLPVQKPTASPAR